MQMHEKGARHIQERRGRDETREAGKRKNESEKDA